MLRLMVSHVRPDQLDSLRAWFRTLEGTRRAEALETFSGEGTRHEVVELFTTPEGPMVVYAIEVEDEDKARAAFTDSTHQVDEEHKKVLGVALGERVPTERIFDLRAD